MTIKTASIGAHHIFSAWHVCLLYILLLLFRLSLIKAMLVGITEMTRIPIVQNQNTYFSSHKVIGFKLYHIVTNKR